MTHQDHRAKSFSVGECDDPNCGPHIRAFDADDEVICEITMTLEQTLAVIQNLQTILYKKAVVRIK